MKNTAKKTLAMLLCLVMVIGLLPGMTAWAEGTPKTIAAGESYYIGDSISFSDAPPFVYVRYDDDTYYGPSGATAYLIGGENTTVTAPTYSTRDGQWKFKDVLRYEPWASARPLNITGPADVIPLGFKCSGGTGAQNNPFTFEAIYPAAHTHSFTYSASGDTITAACGNDGCDLTENKVTLRIVPNPVLYYDDGQPKEASLEGLDAFNAATGKNISTNDITYFKGDANVTAQIKAGSGTSIKGATYTARLDVEGKRATVTFKLTAKPAPHTHIFSYTVSEDGKSIIATCTQSSANMEACNLTNKQATLTLNAPLHTAYGDGKEANASFSGEIPGVNNPTIHYSKGDTPLSAAPTDAGNYTASCQLGNATASVSYTIATEQTTDPIPSSHTHNFEYSASGDTITATCQNEGCDLTDKKVTLRIVPNPVLYYDDNQPKEASLEGLDAFNAATGKNISTNDISYYKGDANVTAQIKAGSGTSIKGATYTARLDVEGKRATVTFQLTQKPVAHTHSFSYTANGAVITATCTGAGTCDLTNNQATLTLNAPAHQTFGDGLDANATLTGSIPGVTNPTIGYRRSDTPLSSAPTDAGEDYVAWCQLGNATARVTYSIAKSTNTGWTTLPQAIDNLAYTGQPQALITAGVASAGNALYTVGTDPNNEPDVNDGGRPYTSAVPEMTNAGTYYVWYKIDGGKNYTSVAAQKVAVTIGDPASQPRISGFTGTINNANVLTINLRNLPENPRFVVSIADKGSAPLAQSADEAAFALSKEATYIANWNATENRWEVRVKVFGKFLNSKITISVYDGDDAIEIQGFKYGDVGEDTIATSHDISFGDYLQMLSILDSAKYGTLYQTFVAYAAALKAAA